MFHFFSVQGVELFKKYGKIFALPKLWEAIIGSKGAIFIVFVDHYLEGKRFHHLSGGSFGCCNGKLHLATIF